ncbi:adenomatous polyposis coli protein-like isoform X2 [Falco cherrug]|uniref:adenomatous polyposis coli protein-like isoform X2 n=1 Tax=Falco cherrug TaxID=345164 RepID=UPI0024786677|nr:adenomatous polyposis coli protein-like isoform X2 [Falco cherrug]
MAVASYDQLLKQVEALKMENSNLRQELEDNSDHLTKLETEASNMKEVLKQLQGSIEDETMASSGQIDLIERLKELNLESSDFPGVKLRPTVSMHLYGSWEGSVSSPSGECSPVPTGSFPRRGFMNESRESTGYLEELERERSLLLGELEKEEKEKDWYYAQLQDLTKRIDSIPFTEKFSLQTDMTRRQLEYEARQIRAAMEEQLGTCQDMEKRAQVRVMRIQQIEKDVLCIRQLLQSQAAEAERVPQSKHDTGSHDTERHSEGQGTAEINIATTGTGQGSAAQMDHDTASVMNSSNNYSVPRRLTNHLGTKVEMVYSLLSMLGTHGKDDMSGTLLAMSSSQDSCISMRQSGCLPLLIQLLHGNDKDSVLLGNSRCSKEARARARAALHNIIHSQPDDKRGRREIRVLHLLEQVRAYCETCWKWQEAHEEGMDRDKNPMCVLMKLSFDEEHRHAMNELGCLQAIAELLQVDCEMYGLTNDHYSVTLRRYAGMALTNLTFGDVANKATLCSMKDCMRALVAQLKSESEDLQQVIASVLRNLSWRADVNSKKTLREVGSVKALMECALEVKKESTLKSVLSALWNLSAHCTENKGDICAVDGALAFLVGTLTYRSQANTLAIIESGGGILRNVSSLIATNEDHRQILRENSCLQTLLQHLKSHSLTIVSNACGTLWNLSARNAKDQEALWDMGAVSMLKNLIHSKHKMIAMGSAAALRNLMANRPAKYKDANIMSPGSSLPSLYVRKQKALEAELDAQHLSETFENIDNLSPKASHHNKQRHKQNIYNEYVLDSSRHDDGICSSETFNTSHMTVLSPYLNATVLPGSSSYSRGNIENSRSEKDRSLNRDVAVGLNSYHQATENTGNSSKRIGMQITAAAQIAKVMEEVTSMHIPQEDRSSCSTSEMHCLTEDRNVPRKTAAAHTHSNTYFPKSENSNGTCPMLYTTMEYKRASNDSLNSVSSSDGYGKRGQMKPSIESYSEDDESKFRSYGQYPADLAHKIHSANHMDDNDEELDTPINYSLKYSDEQLSSGRQSPSQNERWARPKHIIEDEIKQNEQRQLRSKDATYSVYTESGDDKCMKYQSPFGQQECVSSFRSRGSNGAEQSRVGSMLGMNQKVNQSLCQADDYDNDKPTNYSECYSKEEHHKGEEDRPTNYSIKYNKEEHLVDQPIDYSLKYSTEVPLSSQKPSFTISNSSSVQSTKTDDISLSCENISTPSGSSERQNQLHPNSAQSRSSHAQKTASCKTSSINQETIQTYCVEDTPICFSRCSSLSSLSSAEDEIGCDQPTHVTDANNTLQIAELKENSGILSTEGAVSEVASASQHIRTKSSRLQTPSLSPSDSSRHKAVEFSSGAKSPSKSGAHTPKSPPEHYVQETPLMFSRCTSVSSLDSFESHSIASSVQSEPCSGMVSGIISPSDLPDSPGQTMPPSRSKTPPPAQGAQVKKEVAKGKVPNAEKRESGPRQVAINEAVQRVQVLPDADTLLHFATESTPDGFSCSSSLSGLSLDEPFIQKDVELRIMPPVHENEHGNEAEPEQPDVTKDNQEKKAEKPTEAEKDIMDDSDDDIVILEEYIISAMPTKSSHKAKKPSQASASKIPPPVTRKPSQLLVYKLLPSQTGLQSQKRVSFTPGYDMPWVYFVEDTPINFSTATSLSDLTIESLPNELANVENVGTGAESEEFEKRDTIPTEGISTDNSQRAKSSTKTAPGLDDDKTEEGDILAECINSAMPKGKSHKSFRVKKVIDQIQQASLSVSNTNQSEHDKKEPMSPVKPIPQNNEYRAHVRKNTEPKSYINNERSYSENTDTKKQNLKNNSRYFNDKLPNNEEHVKGNFAFDSPHHYTPIEGTPYCFSRNDSLSSLDFDDYDDVDLSRENAELQKRKAKETETEDYTNTEQSSNQQPSNRTQVCQKYLTGRSQPETFSQSTKDIPDRGAAVDEKMQDFAIENTPVNFSRNSSLRSLSDIDQENNNKESERAKQTEGPDSQIESNRPQTSSYAPKSFIVEDTPVCFSRNSSLSSLSIDSEDDLLQECISSAMPKKKKPSKVKSESEKNNSRNMGDVLAEDLSLDLRERGRTDSEHGFSPDSENFDWKAIQEGANSIVSSLHQAAAAISLTRQASSDSDSILSLKSGIFLGSPFHLTPDQEEKPFTSNKGPRILKPGEKSTLEYKKVESENKGIKGGKKVYKSIITGKACSNSKVSSQLRQPQQTNMTSISRGRTMIHIPGVRNSSSSTSPVTKKGPPLKNTNSKSPSEGQNSVSSPRGVNSSVKLESAPVTRQPSQQSRSSKRPSRSGSRDSTPSRPQQQPLSRPLQSPGQNSISPGRNGISPPNKLSHLPMTSSSNTVSTKSSSSGRMLYTAPGRQLSQQNLTKQTALTKSTSGIPRSESASKGLNQILNSGGSNKKAELSRMSSAKSSGSESDRSERPVLVRQSTFIKETSSPTLRQKFKESASYEFLSPYRPGSPTRSQIQIPVLSPSLPNMSLSTHLTAQTSSWQNLPPNLSPSVEYDGRPTKHHDIARSHSESPSRLPINRLGTWKREHSKHSSSLPRVSTWRRSGSSSSVLSASSESSEKTKSEDEKQHESSVSRHKQSNESQASAKATWRKIKENEIPQIMNEPKYSSAGATNDTDSKTLIYQMAPAVSKTEDVWVRIEDCPINKPRSGRSPTGNTPPVIDSVSEKGSVNNKDSKEITEKQNPENRNVPVHTIGLENCPNSFFQIDSPDKKGTEAKPGQNNPVPAPENNESTVNEHTPFSSSSSSKHNSPSGTVAARVTPFNYSPSPRKSSVDNSSARPSQIPTPINNSTKKHDSKTENTDSSETQSPKRHSGSYLVTSV